MSTGTILILGFLVMCAIVLVSFFLAFMDGAKVYENRDITRDYHSHGMKERGKNVIYGRLQSGDK